jgi:hypothetical protein
MDAQNLLSDAQGAGIAEAKKSISDVSGKRCLLPQVAVHRGNNATGNRLKGRGPCLARDEQFDLELAGEEGLLDEKFVQGTHDLNSVSLNARKRLRQKASVNCPRAFHSSPPRALHRVQA